MLKNTFWTTITALVLIISYIVYAHPDEIVMPSVHNKIMHDVQPVCAGYPGGICESCTVGQCGGKDSLPQTDIYVSPIQAISNEQIIYSEAGK
jgi:hypothetical protein